jgi:hypothetical protein
LMRFASMVLLPQLRLHVPEHSNYPPSQIYIHSLFVRNIGKYKSLRL